MTSPVPIAFAKSRVLAIAGSWLCLGVALGSAVSANEKTLPGEAGKLSSKVTESKKIGVWRREETANFQVWTLASSAGSPSLAETCETLRGKLQEIWIPSAGTKTWSPKCVVVVHGDLKAYQRAIGNPRDGSVGATTFAIDKEQIVSRRIDLRADATDWASSALPHELTHLVLADVLQGRPLPRWADEGLAVLAESAAKQAQRAQVLQRAIVARSAIHTAELVALEGHPAAHQRDVFYGQSASLAAFLVRRESPERFIEFALLSTRRGADAALREVYGIESAGRLDALWKADVLTQRPIHRSLEQLVVD